MSGLTIEASTGKGFLLLALPLVLMVAASHIVTQRRYRIRWLIGVLGFLVISALNGSRPSSILLIVSTMILYEALQAIPRKFRPIRYDYQLIALILVVLMTIAVVDLGLGRFLHFWTLYAATETPLVPLPRLKLLFSEPSYLGIFAVAFAFSIPHTGLRLMLAAITLMTQSLFAFAYCGLLLARRHVVLTGLGAIAALVTVAVMAAQTENLYFQSSGLVRLVGLSILNNFTPLTVLVGNGLGAGDAALESLFNSQGVETANGFLFSLAYDMGLLGMFFIYLTYTRRPFDIIHLTGLLLNFGLGSFLVPVLMILVPVAQTKKREGVALVKVGPVTGEHEGA